MILGGIDIGACTVKTVLIDADLRIIAQDVRYSGTDFKAAAEAGRSACLTVAGLRLTDVCRFTATGYGRKNIHFADSSLTEISCHAKGCGHLHHGPMTIVDIGGQDNKIIKLDEHGKRTGFKMNRKCAAGTGAFLEEMALRLRLPLEQLNFIAASADDEVELSGYCTVFSGTEVLEKIRSGVPVPYIVKGLFRSVVKRILELDVLTDTIVMTGGVVQHNPAIANILEEYVNGEVIVPPVAQIMGAFGAALHSAEQMSLKPAQPQRDEFRLDLKNNLEKQIS